MISTLQLLRTHPAHIGSAPLKTLSGISDAPTDASSAGTSAKTKDSFENYLLDAMQYVNKKQNASDAAAQQLITDPDSLDVHDVTIAMAEASLSLNIAQAVIDRLIKGWNEVTTTR